MLDFTIQIFMMSSLGTNLDFQFTDADSGTHMQLNGSWSVGNTFIATLVGSRIHHGYRGTSVKFSYTRQSRIKLNVYY